MLFTLIFTRGQPLLEGKTTCCFLRLNCWTPVFDYQTSPLRRVTVGFWEPVCALIGLIFSLVCFGFSWAIMRGYLFVVWRSRTEGHGMGENHHVILRKKFALKNVYISKFAWTAVFGLPRSENKCPALRIEFVFRLHFRPLPLIEELLFFRCENPVRFMGCPTCCDSHKN